MSAWPSPASNVRRQRGASIVSSITLVHNHHTPTRQTDTAIPLASRMTATQQSPSNIVASSPSRSDALHHCSTRTRLLTISPPISLHIRTSTQHRAPVDLRRSPDPRPRFSALRSVTTTSMPTAPRPASAGRRPRPRACSTSRGRRSWSASSSLSHLLSMRGGRFRGR